MLKLATSRPARAIKCHRYTSTIAEECRRVVVLELVAAFQVVGEEEEVEEEVASAAAEVCAVSESNRYQNAKCNGRTIGRGGFQSSYGPPAQILGRSARTREHGRTPNLSQNWVPSCMLAREKWCANQKILRSLTSMLPSISKIK